MSDVPSIRSGIHTLALGALFVFRHGGVGVRRVVLARGELDKFEGPKYAARRAVLRREAGEAARERDRQVTAASQNEAEESGATEEEATGGRMMRVGRPRGGMKVAARIGEGLRREIRL